MPLTMKLKECGEFTCFLHFYFTFSHAFMAILTRPDSIIRAGFKGLIISLNRVGWDKAKNQASLWLEQGCLNEDCSWSCVYGVR